VGIAGPDEMSDPLPQALILTAIVITFGVAAFLLAIIHRSWRLVREEVVGTDEEDRRVAARKATDADELDPDDLLPDDRPAGHADSLHGPPDELFADDVELPRRRRRAR
jgi:multicomponent Na+:H+ antiporter subunit C